MQESAAGRRMDRAYFGKNGIVVYNDDILKIGCIDRGSVDLIVTSPAAS
jgi:hypothetical protein